MALVVSLFASGERLFRDNRWLQRPFDTEPYDRHIDEYAWYHYTFHYHLLFHEGDVAFSHWRDDVPAIGQPNVYKFVLGWWLDCHGIAVNTSEATMRRWWQPLTDDATFKAFLAENLPFPDEALHAGRVLSAGFAFLALLVSVVYVTRLTSLCCGVVGAVLIGNLELLGVTRMMADSLLLLAFVTCFLLFDLIAECRRPMLRAVLIVTYSVVVGLTMGIKLTGFLALAFLPALLAIRCVRSRTRPVCKDAVAWSLAHGGLAWLVFVGLHPQVYRHPVGVTLRFFSHQLPATAGRGMTVLASSWDELRFQIGELAENLLRLLRLDGHGGLGAVTVIAVVVVVAGLGLGLAAPFVTRGRRLSPTRVLPLFVTLAGFSALLSHRLDERYTWLVTIVLSFFMVLGLDLLVHGRHRPVDGQGDGG